MQPYQFDRIYSQMGKEFGKIKSGQEDTYAMLLFPIEHNALIVHRKNPASNSRRMREAIGLALFDIKARYTGTEIPLEPFRNPDNEKLENAILMAFDPFTNEEIHQVLSEQMNLEDRNCLRDYYTEPIKCLLRIKDSVDIWEKQMGANGYFLFIEDSMGKLVTKEKMEYSIILRETKGTKGTVQK